MNPKILIKAEDPELLPQDYPRFTPEMMRILEGIRKFRETVRGWRN